MLHLILDLPVRRGCAIVVSTHLLPDVELVCDHAVIMYGGKVRFVGTVEELRGGRGRDLDVVVEVKDNAQSLADALATAGAKCTVSSPTQLAVELPAGATTQLVFGKAREAGLQVRGLEIGKRESLETAFLRVIGEEPS